MTLITTLHRRAIARRLMYRSYTDDSAHLYARAARTHHHGTVVPTRWVLVFLAIAAIGPPALSAPTTVLGVVAVGGAALIVLATLCALWQYRDHTLDRRIAADIGAARLRSTHHPT